MSAKNTSTSTSDETKSSASQPAEGETPLRREESLDSAPLRLAAPDAQEAPAPALPEPFERLSYEGDKSVKFYPLPPKLGALPRLMSALAQIGPGTIGEAQMVTQLAMTYLYVEKADAPGGKRLATQEEIEDCLDLDDLGLLTDLNERFLNSVLNNLGAGPASPPLGEAA